MVGRFTQGIVGGGLLEGSAGVAFTSNLSPATTTRLRAGYAAMQGGTRNMVIAVMGDSVDRGVDETAVPYNTQYSSSVAEQLVNQLKIDGFASGANNWYGISGTNLNDYVIRDERITVGGTAASGSGVVQGGASLSMSSATATMSFTPQRSCTKADIYTLQNSAFNGAQLQVQVDGVNTTTITQDATNTIRKTTVSLGALDRHTITINWVSGANALYGIECYDDTRKEITVRQWAQSGATVSQMTDNTGTPSAGRVNQMNLFPPDVVIGDLGLVNSWRNGTAIATVQTQVDAIIDAIKAAGADFIFVVPPFDSGSAGNTAIQQQYIDMVTARCLVKGCAWFNLRSAPNWTSKAASDAAGYTSAPDFVHKTIAGQANTALLLKPVLRSGMGLVSAVSVPAKLAALRSGIKGPNILKAMASPPTLTMGAENANSTVVPANYDAKYPANDPLFTYSGGVVATQASTGPPGPVWAKGAGANYGTGNGYQGHSAVYFKCSDADVDLNFNGQQAVQAAYRVSIDLFDGKGLRATNLVPRTDIQAVANGNGRRVKIANGSVTPRGYRIEFDNFLFFAGVDVAGTIQKWDPGGPKILIEGDSHVASSGASADFLGMAPRLKEYLGTANVMCQGQGGSAYTTTSIAGTETMRARIPNEITPRNPDLLVDLAGYNQQTDTPAVIQAEVTAYLNALALALPDMYIIKVGSPRRGIAAGAGFTPSQARADAIKAAVLADPRYGTKVFFVDSWALDWEHGTGRVGATTGDGNADTWVTTDNVHRTDVGHTGWSALLGPAIMAPLGVK